MQRLSGLDANFLYLETSDPPMHMYSTMELDTSTMPGGDTFGRRVCRRVEELLAVNA